MSRWFVVALAAPATGALLLRVVWEGGVHGWSRHDAQVRCAFENLDGHRRENAVFQYGDGGAA